MLFPLANKVPPEPPKSPKGSFQSLLALNLISPSINLTPTLNVLVT